MSVNSVDFSYKQESCNQIRNSSSIQKSIQVFHATLSSPDHFLFHHIDESPVKLDISNICSSTNLNHIKSSRVIVSPENYWYLYMIEISGLKNEDQTSRKTRRVYRNISLQVPQMLFNNSISLRQMYFIDSNNLRFHTGLLESFGSNIKDKRLKQFQLCERLKSNIKKYQSKKSYDNRKILTDLQKTHQIQSELLKKNQESIFGKKIVQETEEASKKKYKLLLNHKYFIKTSSPLDQVQLVILNWISHFLEVYEKNPKHGIKMLLDNKTNLLCEICSNLRVDKYLSYDAFVSHPTTYYSLRILILILEMLYVQKELEKKDLIDFLFSTSFILEASYSSSARKSYAYLFKELIQEYDLQEEIFSRMYSSKTTCLCNEDKDNFLLRLKRGIIRAKLKWDQNNDTRDIDSLYPLLKELDSIRINDNLSLRKRIQVFFSQNKTSLKEVLSEFYLLEKKMKKKKYHPVETPKKNISINEIKTLLNKYKKQYYVDLNLYTQEQEKARENYIKRLENNIEELEKNIKILENVEDKTDFDVGVIFAGAFSMLVSQPDPAISKRTIYSMKQDAIKKAEDLNQEAVKYNRRDIMNSIGSDALAFSIPLLISSIKPSSTEHNTIQSMAVSNKNGEEIDINLRSRLKNLRKNSEDNLFLFLDRQEREVKELADPTDRDLEERLKRLRS